MFLKVPKGTLKSLNTTSKRITPVLRHFSDQQGFFSYENKPQTQNFRNKTNKLLFYSILFGVGTLTIYKTW